MPKSTSFGQFAEILDAKSKNSGVPATKYNIQAIFTLLGSNKNKNYYEIACGNGFLARKLVTSGAKSVMASDISPELINIAQTKYNSSKINYSVREGSNISGLPKNSFDAVIIHQGIFYIRNIRMLFKNINKILKPNGIVIFTFNHPLFPLFRGSIGEKTVMGEALDYIDIAKHYSKAYRKTVTKNWLVDGVSNKVKYDNYHRPISYYINACAANNLMIDAMIEPKSRMKIKSGKIIDSSIPGSVVIRARKI